MPYEKELKESSVSYQKPLSISDIVKRIELGD